MTLTELDLEPAFALLGPGFRDDHRWTLLRPSPEGDATLWVAPYAERPIALPMHARLVDPQLIEGHQPQVTLHEDHFLEKVSAIRARIAAGDVYQVNLTLRASVTGLTGPQLVSVLCTPQVPRFAAWVRLPGLPEFVSASPELLVETTGRTLHAEPMKGTAPKGQTATLAASEKDNAELAMITDLLRNDFHRLCVRGSVQVPSARRFVELPYLVQAVSDVTGTLRPDVTLEQVLAQLHPGGSVTGAPRPAAMHLISRLESTPRGLYCGTLGLQLGDTLRCALLIRTATKTKDREWTYGVGSGITWDSDPQAELDEVRLKLGALTWS